MPLQPVDRTGLAVVVEALACLEEEVVGCDVFRGAALKKGFLLRRECGLQQAGDVVRESRLDRENVGQVAIVGLRPDVLVGLRVDQLARHTHLRARAPHAPLEEISHAELLADLADGLRCLAILHDGGARNDSKLANEGQVGTDVLMDAISKEEAALLIVAHVGERKDGDRFRFRICADRACTRTRA